MSTPEGAGTFWQEFLGASTHKTFGINANAKLQKSEVF
jgi:hypothetical protein